MLSVPPDRLKITDMDNNELMLHLAIPKSLRVHDRWSAETVTYDVMEVYIPPVGPDSLFVLRVSQLWTHDYLMDKLASITRVAPNDIALTDMHGNPWRYPDSRLSTMSVMMRVRKEQAQDLASQRGGAHCVYNTGI